MNDIKVTTNSEYSSYGTVNYIIGFLTGVTIMYFSVPWWGAALLALTGNFVIGFIMGFFK